MTLHCLHLHEYSPSIIHAPDEDAGLIGSAEELEEPKRAEPVASRARCKPEEEAKAVLQEKLASSSALAGFCLHRKCHQQPHTANSH